jgi:predicted AAA+ superfamily ATPase
MVTRVIRRNIRDQLLQALADTPVVLINGARQTGKKTLVQSREVADERSRQYLTFDDAGVLAAARRKLEAALLALQEKFAAPSQWTFTREDLAKLMIHLNAKSLAQTT